MARTQLTKVVASTHHNKNKNEVQQAYMATESPENRHSTDKNKEEQIRAHLQKLAQKQKKKVIDLTKTLEIRPQAPPVQGSGG